MQTAVIAKLANGVVGERYDDTPFIIDSYLLSGTGTIGYVTTVSSEGVVAVGGTGAFAGIICNPKQYVTDGLGATNNVIAGTQVAVGKKGRYWLDLNGAAVIGDGVYFVDATGALGAGAAGVGQTQIVGAEVVLYTVAANGLAVVEI